MYLNNGINQREDFSQAIQTVLNAFPGWTYNQVIAQMRPTQSRLRLEKPIVTTSNQYNFDILENRGAPTNTEVRLKLQDILVPTKVGFYLGNPGSSTDAEYNLYSYNNPFIFTGATAEAMMAIYNGNFSILVQNNQLVNNWPAMWHYSAPRTQQTAAPGAGSPIDEFDGSSHGIIPMVPGVYMVGSQNINITLNLPVAVSSALPNSRLVLVFDGFLFQNATPVG